jgi:hypothetical protein
LVGRRVFATGAKAADEAMRATAMVLVNFEKKEETSAKKS